MSKVSNSSFSLFSSIRKLYDWVLGWAKTPYGLWALVALSFIESVFFPIPPDVLLIAMVLGARTQWFRLALACTIASMLGGITGYGLGLFAWDVFSPYFFSYVPGFNGLFLVVLSHFLSYFLSYFLSHFLTPFLTRFLTHFRNKDV